MLYGFLGVVLGALFSLISLIGLVTWPRGEDSGRIVFVFGAFAILIAPVAYGLMGAITAGLAALLYKLAARFVGGLEIEVLEKPSVT